MSCCKLKEDRQRERETGTERDIIIDRQAQTET